MSERSECSIDGCDARVRAREWCGKHYTRWIRHGTPEGQTPESRFWAMVTKTPSCWLWNGVLDHLGYGTVKRLGVITMAHRYAWVISGNELPAGRVVDHLCHNRGCVRPDHLRVVTQAQNSQNRNGAPRNSTTGIRGVSFEAARNAYTAKFRLNGQDHYLGSFSTAAEAEAVVVKARREHMRYSEMDKVAA